MDKTLRSEIKAEVRAAMEGINEKYVVAETLCQHIEVMTPAWLKRYGYLLDRTRIEMTDANGTKHKTSWMYPLNKIIRMLETGELKNLKNI